MKIILSILLISFSATAQIKAGLKLQNIEPGSIYEKLGLKNGDIIKKVNEKEIPEKENIESLSDELSKSKKIRLLLERNGKEEILKYTIK
jgi:general secretion pathway protein C